ncbi:hypothetical protein FLL45_06395 [Aliikangiella marina]|uniref:PKD domain-containing protein n=1 Tax=Aliikangiella marina TaxID=1712262 RepID=A0A545TBL1_9GAMM|nr:hypothetical protein [Aliikangiella marina]TQV74589.1 hypothetical protein FLL45_06395 [Aliikangiella marina]
MMKIKLKIVLILLLGVGLIACGSVIVHHEIKEMRISEDLNAALKVSRRECIAPCGVMFDASKFELEGYASPFYELEYHWNFGDDGAKFVNRPGVDANKSLSPIASHVFDSAGMYRVELQISDRGDTIVTERISIRVREANNAYRSLTYCVSVNEDFEDCPGKNHLNSFAEAKEVLQTLRNFQDRRPARVLFRAGEEFTTTLDRVSISGLSANLLISSYGKGEKPIIKVNRKATAAQLFYLSDFNGVTVSNLHFKGNYNPVTGHGNHPDGFFFWTNSKNSLLYRNKFSGLGLNIYPHGHGESKYQMIVDNEIFDWQDYAVLGNFGYLSAVVGNRIRQNPNARSGKEGKCQNCVPNFPDHGGIRTALPDHLLIQHNDFFNNAGWSTGGLAHQPNVRIGTNGNIVESVIADNLFEGGFAALEMIPANNGPNLAAKKGELIVERNKFTATNNTMTFINTSLAGLVIRNNIFHKPDNGAPPIGTRTFKSVIWFNAANTTDENLTHDNFIYNNTFLSEAKQSAPNVAFLEVANKFSRFTLRNNVISMPYVNDANRSGLVSVNYLNDNLQIDSSNNILHAPQLGQFYSLNDKLLNLTELQASGKETNSQDIQDGFEIDLNGDILVGVQLIKSKGALVNGLNNDRNGKSREDLVDLGAYQLD